MSETDWTDRHVARWRDHWIDIHFDDQVEGIVVRIGRLARYLKSTMQTAVAEVGLQEFEYQTLHSLMIRDTPGTASPTDLADDLDVSGAGMTGRLDGLEKAGWVQRTASPDDRRRVVVEITKSGAEIWRRAPELAFARARTVDDLWGFCRTCPFGATCLGGCSFTAHTSVSRVTARPPCVNVW